MEPSREELLEVTAKLQEALVNAATGGRADEGCYQDWRRQLLDDPSVTELVPSFVRSYRTQAQYWNFIKAKFPTYAERRVFLWDSFKPLLDYLERCRQRPALIRAKARESAEGKSSK